MFGGIGRVLREEVVSLYAELRHRTNGLRRGSGLLAIAKGRLTSTQALKANRVSNSRRRSH